MTEKIRIAVAGAGTIVQAHTGMAQRSPSCTLTAVVDPSPIAQAAAQQAGVPLYASLVELFEKGRPDGEAQPLVSARDGLANLRVTEAIGAAAASGRTVELLPL